MSQNIRRTHSLRFLLYFRSTVVIAIAVGTGVGVNSLIARRLGRADAERSGQRRTARRCALGCQRHCIYLHRVFPSAARFFLPRSPTVPPSLSRRCSITHIAVGLSIFVMISIMCEKIQQATGNMIIPMVQGLTGAIFNIILDPLMIFGMRLSLKWASRRGNRHGNRTGFRHVCRHLGRFLSPEGGRCPHARLPLGMGALREIYRVGLPGIIMQEHFQRHGFCHEPDSDYVLRSCRRCTRHLL